MQPKIGDNLNGYILTKEFTEDKAGHCVWGFAKKDGKEYFIKRFIRPIYPIASAMGSDERKAKNLEASIAFEQRQSRIQELLRNKSLDGGNLIITRDFFRVDSHFYKITDKVNIASLTATDICKHEIEKKLLLLRTLAHSLKILHSVYLVHGDIKPDNILIKITLRGFPVSKLIDFDDGFIEGQPPSNPDDLVGDPVYYSPEMRKYIRHEIPPQELTVKSDVFAMGLVFHQYLTGKLPVDFGKYGYAHDAVENDHLSIARELLPDWISSLLSTMLHKDYHLRPDMNTVFRRLSLREKSLEESKGVEGSSLKGDLVTRKFKEKDVKAGLKGKGLSLSDK